MNRYIYCGNDPVNKTDPSGHFVWVLVGAVIVGVVVGLLDWAGGGNGWGAGAGAFATTLVAGFLSPLLAEYLLGEKWAFAIGGALGSGIGGGLSTKLGGGSWRQAGLNASISMVLGGFMGYAAGLMEASSFSVLGLSPEDIALWLFGFDLGLGQDIVTRCTL